MKTKKLLERVAEYLDLTEQLRRSQRAEIKVILKKLKKKERSARGKIAAEENELTKKRLQREVDIIHAQRRKGLNAYQEVDE
jgi:hypothetical protein